MQPSGFHHHHSTAALGTPFWPSPFKISSLVFSSATHLPIMLPATTAMAATLSLSPFTRQDAPALLPRAVLDHEALANHQARKREELEALVRRDRWDAAAWARYACWETSRGDRAPSLWERALRGAGYRDPALWVGYAESEVRRRRPSRARAVWDRAVAALPRADLLWHGYARMEEALGNLAGARQVFDRWMEWRPRAEGWAAYAEFELRCGEVVRARAVFERLVACRRGDPSAWARYAEFEARHGGVARARACYERAATEAVGAPGEEGGDPGELLAAFAEFKERCGELDRARWVYWFAMARAGTGAGLADEELRREYDAFERRCRARAGSVSPADGFLGGTSEPIIRH